MKKIINDPNSLIIIIDDSDIDAFLLQKHLKSMDYKGRVIHFTHSYNALNYFTMAKYKEAFEAIPDLIFLDVNMPNMNGFEFVEAFKRQFPKNITEKSKIILCSFSHKTKETIARAKASGIKEFLSKPIDKEVLKLLVENE